MAENSIVTDEMKAKIGTMMEPVVYEVERGAIRRFAQAVGDLNPLYSDEDYARETPYGEVVCPPGFFGLPAGDPVGTDKLLNLIESPLKNILNGGNEAEFYRPIRPGDVLVNYMKISDIYEKGGGKMLFVILEGTFKNQMDQEVGRMRYNVMFV